MPEALTNFCQSCTVRNRAICGDLHDDEINVLNKIGRRRWVEAGEQVLWEGDDAVVVANVIEGLLKLSTQTSEGKEQILGIAYPSDFLGRPFGETTPYGVEALTPALVCTFQRSDFDHFAREHPRLEHKLLERTLSELDRTRRWMLLLGRMNAEQKMATFLLDMADRLVPASGKRNSTWPPGSGLQGRRGRCSWWFAIWTIRPTGPCWWTLRMWAGKAVHCCPAVYG